jgi:hypothetical protein
MTTPIAPIEIDAEYNPKDIATANVNVCGYADSEAANRVGKKLIASAISDKGIGASGDDSFADLAKQIGKISYKANKVVYQTSVDADNIITLRNIITTYEGEIT